MTVSLQNPVVNLKEKLAPVVIPVPLNAQTDPKLRFMGCQMGSAEGEVTFTMAAAMSPDPATLEMSTVQQGRQKKGTGRRT